MCAVIIRNNQAHRETERDEENLKISMTMKTNILSWGTLGRCVCFVCRSWFIVENMVLKVCKRRWHLKRYLIYFCLSFCVYTSSEWVHIRKVLVLSGWRKLKSTHIEHKISKSNGTTTAKTNQNLIDLQWNIPNLCWMFGNTHFSSLSMPSMDSFHLTWVLFNWLRSFGTMFESFFFMVTSDSSSRNQW